MELARLFPAGAHIVSLPTSNSPRILLMGCNAVKRWKESSFYPAYKFSARLYRVLLRLKATAGLHAVCLAHSDPWLIKEFVHDVFPNICSQVVLIGTSSPTQKLIIQIWDEERVIAYLKFAQSAPAVTRLEREHEILRRLPPGISPTVLRFGEMGSGKGLLLTPIFGKALTTQLPPPQTLCSFVRSLETSLKVPIHNHPWIQELRSYSRDCVEPWIDRLSKRQWPIVYQHGDLAPWNLFLSRGKLEAVDWEYGTAEGFPYADIIHYYLQVSLLIYKSSPHKTKHYLIKFLNNLLKDFSPGEIAALVNLSVFNTFIQAEHDGHQQHSNYQAWRRAIWMI